MAAPAFAFTISRAAEILGEDEQLLWDLASADEMDPENGCVWIHGTKDQQTIAFAPAGMESLSELLAEHKRNRPPAALNGWLRIIHRIIQGFHKRRNNVRISAKNLQKIYRKSTEPLVVCTQLFRIIQGFHKR